MNSQDNIRMTDVNNAMTGATNKNDDNLTENEQMALLNFITITSIEDTNLALRYLKKSNFIMDKALDMYFNGRIPDMEEEKKTENFLGSHTPSSEFINLRNFTFNPLQNQAARGGFPLPNNQPNNSVNDLSLKYRQYKERKQREEEEVTIIDNLLYIPKKLFSYVTGVYAYLKNDSLGAQFLNHMNRRYSNLRNELVIFESAEFEDCLLKAKNEKKPLLAYIHEDGQPFTMIPTIMLTFKPLTDLFKKAFVVMGIVANSDRANFITKYVETKDLPCLGIFRLNIVEEPSVIEIIPLKSDFDPRALVDKVKDALANFPVLEEQELKIKKRIDREIESQRLFMENMNLRGFNPFFQMNPYPGNEFTYGMGIQNGNQVRERNPLEQQRLEEDRMLRRLQEEEYKEVERKIKEQKEKELLESIKKKQEEEEILRKIEEERLLKEAKKNSLPMELPEEDPNAILIIIRLPDGTRIQRRFDRMNHKIQVLYDFVDINDVKFEHTNHYDLIQPHPFTILTDKNKAIDEIFTDSTHEVIHIREHI